MARTRPTFRISRRPGALLSADKAIPKGYYRAAVFCVCGGRAVRVDILERLADLICPYRLPAGHDPGDRLSARPTAMALSLPLR